MDNKRILEVAADISVNETKYAKLVLARHSIETELKETGQRIEDAVKRLLEMAEGEKQVIIVGNMAYLVDPDKELVEILPMIKKTLF